MQEEVKIKKKKLLQRISKERYISLTGYIEKVYLSKYDLKILMARKFSNLFFALLPIVKEENGNRVRYLYDEKFKGAKEKPLIVSNRALAVLKKEIQSGRYKRILLADDIIIHGRTMESIYLMLKNWIEEAGIQDYEIAVYSYAESDDGLIKDEEFQEVLDVNKCCVKGAWRAISNEIVDIFYLLGTPYTSYVPNCRVSKKSELGRIIKNRLNNAQSGFISQTNVDMEMYSVKTYVYIGQNKSPAILNTSIRIYEYEALQQYNIVPMVMLNPVEESTLKEYFNVITEVMDQETVKLLKTVMGDDIIYRTVVYVLSALWGWTFVKEVLSSYYTVLHYDTEEERINFNAVLLKDGISETLTEDQICKIWKEINGFYNETVNLLEIVQQEEDFNKLDYEMNQIIKEYLEDNQTLGDNTVRELLGKYLTVNGDLDEERCKKSNRDEKRRLMGYPVALLPEKLEKFSTSWMTAVLYAIDFGKGSIVSKTLEYGQKKYYFSVIHAGEQNYKYYENTYFPFLYGLYHIENIAAKKNDYRSMQVWKNMFVDRLLDYWKEKKYFYLDSDMISLKEMYITMEYEQVIINAAWGYFSQPDFEYAIQLAKEITR